MSTLHKTTGGRIVDAFGLAVILGIMFVGARFAPGIRGDAGVLGAIGFLLLAGTLMSELVEVIGVPHLTGYLLAGIIAGPHVLHLIDEESTRRLEAVNTLAISMIALSGGAELRIAQLREGFKGLLTATVLQSLLGMLVVGGIFMLARPGFTRDMPAAAALGVAILWGVLSITRSPSAVLGILSQTRAAGPLARFSLAFVMASDVVVVVMLALALTIARPLIDPGAALSSTAFSALGHEILGSVALGTTLGLVLAVYLRVMGRQLLVVLVALGFGMTEVLRYLSLEPLLTFIVAGFIVQNLSKQGEKLNFAIEGTGSVVYVIFFAEAGAHFNVPILREYWSIALLLTLSRAAVTFGTARLASAIAKDPPAVRKWAWSSLVSQAGIALGVAQTIAKMFPQFGADFRDVAIACIALNELFGPILFKLALDRTRETKGPAPSLTDIEETAA